MQQISTRFEEERDTKNMRENLMREMLWQQPPQTVELYQLKKDLKKVPEYKNVQITEMEGHKVRALKEKLQLEKEK